VGQTESSSTSQVQWTPCCTCSQLHCGHPWPGSEHHSLLLSAPCSLSSSSQLDRLVLMAQARFKENSDLLHVSSTVIYWPKQLTSSRGRETNRLQSSVGEAQNCIALQQTRNSGEPGHVCVCVCVFGCVCVCACVWNPGSVVAEGMWEIKHLLYYLGGFA
jgi:hypothetical protein